MQTMAPSHEIESMLTATAKPAVNDKPAVVTTTLYDLIAAVQAILGPEEEHVVPMVTHMLRTGRASLERAGALPLSA